MDTIPDARSGLKGELFLEVLRTFGSARLRVTGTSMLPSIWPGDILEVGVFPFSIFDFRFSIFEPRVSSLDYRPLTVDSRLSTFHCDSIRPGELVLYERAGRFFAHRVVGAMQMPIADCPSADGCGHPSTDGLLTDDSELP